MSGLIILSRSNLTWLPVIEIQKLVYRYAWLNRYVLFNRSTSIESNLIPSNWNTKTSVPLYIAINRYVLLNRSTSIESNLIPSIWNTKTSAPLYIAINRSKSNKNILSPTTSEKKNS